jgi:hypothetical protein
LRDYTRNYDGTVRAVNRVCSIVVGIYFLGIFFYLLNSAVVPISSTGAWRGIADIVAVGFYLLAVVPLFGLTLVDLNLVGRKAMTGQVVPIGEKLIMQETELDRLFARRLVTPGSLDSATAVIGATQASMECRTYGGTRQDGEEHHVSAHFDSDRRFGACR